MERPNGTEEARIIEVIQTKSIRGLGTKEDPTRTIYQYWDLNGKFLAEFDKQHVVPKMKHDYEAVRESISGR